MGVGKRIWSYAINFDTQTPKGAQRRLLGCKDYAVKLWWIGGNIKEKKMDSASEERAKQFSALWLSQRTSVTQKQKDTVGIAYISKVLGLGKEVAQRFALEDRTAYHEVGMKQGALRPTKEGLRSFWKEIRSLFPVMYSDEDIIFLVEEGGISGVIDFLWQIGEDSPVLHALRVNAHTYK